MGKQSIDLAQFDDDFQSESTAERGDFETVPDGKYQVAVEKVELTQASTGNPMLKWTLRILAPRFAEPVPVAQQRLHREHAEVRQDRPAPLRARSSESCRNCQSISASCSK